MWALLELMVMLLDLLAEPLIWAFTKLRRREPDFGLPAEMRELASVQAAHHDGQWRLRR